MTEASVGNEMRAPQLDQIGRVMQYGNAEDEMPERVAKIAASNHQHPDHHTENLDAETWPV